MLSVVLSVGAYPEASVTLSAAKGAMCGHGPLRFAQGDEVRAVSVARGGECRLPRSGTGDTGTAIRKLSAISDTLCLADNLSDGCFHLNLTLVRLLAARGDDRQAGALLERWRWSGGSTPSFVLATLELGRIAERLGDTRKAAECMASW
jgi:hypothetical protein